MIIDLTPLVQALAALALTALCDHALSGASAAPLLHVQLDCDQASADAVSR